MGKANSTHSTQGNIYILSWNPTLDSDQHDLKQAEKHLEVPVDKLMKSWVGIQHLGAIENSSPWWLC
jgi:hypothetical protein